MIKKWQNTSVLGEKKLNVSLETVSGSDVFSSDSAENVSKAK